MRKYAKKNSQWFFQQMMGVFATGRKAQNYYHYLSMTNSCYFDMLTTNTQVFRLPLLFLCHHPHQRDPHCILIDDTMKIPFQRKLMQQKTLICYSLNVALWFFGHNATTAVGQVLLLLDIMSLWSLSWPPLLQEDLTGMDTGMKDYLTLNHPDLLDKLTPNYYDEIFVVPWATNRQFEKFNTLIQNDSMSSSWWPNWRINENNHFFWSQGGWRDPQGLAAICGQNSQRWAVRTFELKI